MSHFPRFLRQAFRRTLRACAPLALALTSSGFAAASASLAQDSARADDDARDDEDAELATERREADRERRLGNARAAAARMDELLVDEPQDAASRTLRALCRADLSQWREARADAEQAFDDSARGSAELRAECARNLLQILLTLGEADEAARVIEGAGAALIPASDARDAWLVGRALLLRGARAESRETLRRGGEADKSAEWPHLLARARCERALGFLERASRSLIEADRATERADGREPDVLAELASVYFEADGELEHPQAAKRAPGPLYKSVLGFAPNHAPTLLGLFELGRTNWNRQSRSAHEYLDDLLALAPQSIDGLLAACSADLDDGQLVSARERLEILRKYAGKRPDVRTLEAALAWVEHRRDDTRSILGELHARDAADARPEREIAHHLSELYRFAEALEFARAATERDANDHAAWMELGRALANTGDEKAALEALEKSRDLAQGRQDAWRHNTAMVLERMRVNFATESGPGQLSYAWKPDAAEVMRTYWLPFYADARTELAERYGYTPGPTHIEVFERHRDFSVRSTGFEGFPALGVCFGPVVTCVSPLSELRGSFSWARTSFHEFTHVVHLGLSHNRCPRWITEGLATWEEEKKNPAWSRNLRRDLIDALANDDLIRVRDLNRAFRGPRILFGYYQGGLLCRMLIDERGFPPLIRTLEAFDRGLDLDEVLREVFALTPEELDQKFEDWVRAYVAPLKLEPRWSKAVGVRLKLALSEKPPSAAAALMKWTEDWTTVAWCAYQNGQLIDAEQALRRVAQSEANVPRAVFLKAEIAMSKGAHATARELYLAGLAAGGDDYRVRMALGNMAAQDEQWDDAEKHLLAAEKCFPGYAERDLSAELTLAQLYQARKRTDEMQRARERWLAYNADDYDLRLEVAGWHAEQGRPLDAVRLYRQANEVDPFRRALHRLWGEAASAAKLHEEALREFGVALLVPPALDADVAAAPGDPETPDEPRAPSAPIGSTGAITDDERAELLGLQARELVELGRLEEAAAKAREALQLDDDEPNARRALERAQ